MFRKIKGQDKAIAVLRNTVANDKIANSYLFYGPDGVGKFTTALYFGMMINCHASHNKRPCGVCASCKKFLSFSHPDLIYIFPTPKLNISLDGEIKSDKVLDEYNNYIKCKIDTPWKEFFFSKNTEIRIDSIRMLEHRINLTPNEGKRKIYIIEDADQINERAANAFLKTLEEPPDDTVIILTTSKPNSLLPTIISRCQQITFHPIPKNLIEKEVKDQRYLDEDAAKMYARIANGSMEKALRLSEEQTLESRQYVLKLLTIIISQDDSKFLEFAKQFISSKNKSLLYEIISHLIIWISDIVYYKCNPDEIVNLDHLNLLKNLYKRNPKVDEYSSEIVNFLEDMQHRLNGHVNPQLIIIEIYNRLVRIFSKE